MVKKILAVVVISASCLIADPVSLIEAQDYWQYAVLETDLDPIWASVDYSTIDFNSISSWQTGQAAFVENLDFPERHTIWTPGQDMAFQKEITLNGTLSGDLSLDLALDNGAVVFINGTQVFKDYAEGNTWYWEYTNPVSSSLFHQGTNIIQILAADNGGCTYFDCRLTGDITPQAVPEPASAGMLVLGLGLLAGCLRLRNRKP